MIALDRKSNIPLYRQIYAAIVADIASKALAPGSRLPSIRVQANLLNVSQNTIEQSYDKLASEGWVEPRHGSGFFVCPIKHPMMLQNHHSPAYEQELANLCSLNDELFDQEPAEFDFSYSIIDVTSVSQHMWSQVLKELPYAPDWDEYLRYGHPNGLLRLRHEISHYLAWENGLTAAPEQIMISPNTRTSIVSIARLFDPAHDVVAIEEPGFWEARNALSLCGFTIKPLNVLCGPRAFLESLSAAKPKLIYTTPYNQFPTNRIMGTATCQALLQWCQDNDAYLIEDDYCHEFRYGVDHLPSLQAEDTSGSVITIGTFSKSVAPALCLGYIVFPPKLMQLLLKKSFNWHPSTSFLAQEAIAELMSTGRWETHLRRLQVLCRRKYQILTGAIEAHLGNRVNVMDSHAGLHLLIGTRDRRTSGELVALARDAGVKVYPTDLYWMGPIPEEWNYVLLGFMSTPEEKLEPGISRLAQAWFGGV